MYLPLDAVWETSEPPRPGTPAGSRAKDSDTQGRMTRYSKKIGMTISMVFRLLLTGRVYASTFAHYTTHTCHLFSFVTLFMRAVVLSSGWGGRWIMEENVWGVVKR